MNEDAKLMDLTKRYLRLADQENPAVIIGACFNVIANVCAQTPEIIPATAEFMRKGADTMEEGASLVVEH